MLTLPLSILPRTQLIDWVHILSDPTPEELARMLHVGQHVTWPKVGGYRELLGRSLTLLKPSAPHDRESLPN